MPRIFELNVPSGRAYNWFNKCASLWPSGRKILNIAWMMYLTKVQSNEYLPDLKTDEQRLEYVIGLGIMLQKTHDERRSTVNFTDILAIIPNVTVGYEHGIRDFGRPDHMQKRIAMAAATVRELEEQYARAEE